ncbi:stress response protein NST1-like [Musa acuminata AAA Group]|uniref:(wild Malaysian banana) hypothetical protein n=1 Tax=Musa acuminata subsp. malaccensis TaxID=214687 RepID=A0A804IJL8_MUSAM|nr:PREDICTED: stress response protein NST1 [Musa acuminata subsp. malaccensis]XP_009395067.1 PREDICTED: stress response protein NST1 [Musa acuminata subsp. malaccensis]XP_009395068.1 PREDICTED: stress response protein NST1 [Musa acuminata subsp. malaccensis]XP_018680898.1 PREDICTED: stress response protein NST1 [Musa acuminata subsp. malaccensis]XP_018680899.1 PREDICTED: stress response protein NST1 [Musa acuminata subsp. malaccensis]CAG1840830.1 unnamed protein product [Musa acuminata subsp. 
MKSINFGGGLSISSVFFTYGLHYLQTPRSSKLSTVHIAILRNAPHALMAFRSNPKDLHGGTLQLMFDGSPSGISSSFLDLGFVTEQCEHKNITQNEIQFHEFDGEQSEKTDGACKSAQEVSDREIRRRQKIGAANRGKIPWNKGRKHSDETRERIKKRTIEALSDPKVRKKMSESPRSHSDQSKSKISASLTKIWEERLKQKRLQEKCYLFWARTIAEAAKIGSLDQEELEWDSYEKMKADMVSEQIKLKEEKARAKEIAKLRAESVAKDKAEKVAKLAEQRKLQKEKAKARKLEALSRKKSVDERKKTELSKGLKLKAILTKFHHRKRQLETLQTEIVAKPGPDLTLDIELVKNERMQRRISLADQIKAVKNKKAEFAVQRVRANALLDSAYEQRAGDH